MTHLQQTKLWFNEMKQYAFIFVIILLFALLLSTVGYGKDEDNFTRPVITIPQTSQSPEIDGELDEEIWKDAVQVNDFY